MSSSGRNNRQLTGQVDGPRSKRRIGKDTPAARWRKMARLATDALEALNVGQNDRVREILAMIQAVAIRAADEEVARK